MSPFHAPPPGRVQDLESAPSSSAAALAALQAAKEGDAGPEEAAPPPAASTDAQYELTALIAVIQEELPAAGGDTKPSAPQHLVAHIKASRQHPPPPDFDVPPLQSCWVPPAIMESQNDSPHRLLVFTLFAVLVCESPLRRSCVT